MNTPTLMNSSEMALQHAQNRHNTDRMIRESARTQFAKKPARGELPLVPAVIRKLSRGDV